MTPAEFRTRFPAFTAESDARINLAIADADPYFDVDRWAAWYVVGLACWVAHDIALGNALNVMGPVANSAMGGATLTKKVDTVQMGFDTGILNMQAKDPYMRTVYGQRYVELRNLVGLGAVTT